MKDQQTFRFGQVEMSGAKLAELAQDPAITAAIEKKVRSDEADRTEQRIAPALEKLSTVVTAMLAKTQLTPADLGRIRFTIAEDGTCYAEYKQAGRGRSGEPSERFGGFTQSVLKSHNVKRFVRLGEHNKILAEATDGAGICNVESIPYAGQAKHDADANHRFAQCDRKTCTTANHGDNADRLTWNQRQALAANGWCVEYTDGKRAKLDTLDAWESNGK